MYIVRDEIICFVKIEVVKSIRIFERNLVVIYWKNSLVIEIEYLEKWAGAEYGSRTDIKI